MLKRCSHLRAEDLARSWDDQKPKRLGFIARMPTVLSIHGLPVVIYLTTIGPRMFTLLVAGMKRGST